MYLFGRKPYLIAFFLISLAALPVSAQNGKGSPDPPQPSAPDAPMQPDYSSSAANGGFIGGLSLGFLTGGGSTFGWEILSCGLQGGFYATPDKGLSFAFLGDIGFGLSFGGTIDNILPGYLGVSCEFFSEKIMFGFGGGISGGYIGSFLLLLVGLFLDGENTSSDNETDNETDHEIYSPADPTIVPYMRLFLSFGSKKVWPTVYFETHFNYGFKTGLIFNFRSQ
jgi:hypothetical protein